MFHFTRLRENTYDSDIIQILHYFESLLNKKRKRCWFIKWEEQFLKHLVFYFFKKFINIDCYKFQFQIKWGNLGVNTIVFCKIRAVEWCPIWFAGKTKLMNFKCPAIHKCKLFTKNIWTKYMTKADNIPE